VARAAIHDFPCGDNDVDTGVRRHDGGGWIIKGVEINGGWY